MSPHNPNTRHDADRFAELEAYLEEHGKQPSERSEDPKQRELALWFRRQCHALINGELPKEQAERVRQFRAEPTARLRNWARETGIADQVIRKRMKGVRGIDGLTTEGRVFWGAFYTRSQLHEHCADLLISTEEICEELRRIFTREEWATISKKKKRTIEIYGRKLNSIARLLGIAGNPLKSRAAYLQIGEAIWGEYPDFNKDKVGTLEIRRAIHEKFTYEEWAIMQIKERRDIKIFGRKLGAIATLFGVKGDPTSNNTVHQQLGQAIFGKQSVSEEVIREKVRLILRERFTPEIWTSMSAKEKQKIAIHNRKLNAIARIFGLDGDPVGKHTIHIQLGKAIWGDLNCFREMLIGAQEIRTEIKKRFVPEVWAQMSQKEKGQINVCSKKLIAIARLFEIKDNPIRTRAIHLKLGRAIWGKEWKICHK